MRRSTPIAALAAISVLAFAANSLLARAALGGEMIGAGTFTCIRLGAGAAVLVLITRARPNVRHLPEAAALLAYAGAFSFAYVELGTATGAFILFAAVQSSMFGLAILGGERPGARAWSGMLVAFAGLGWLLAPGLHAPPALPALLMIASGTAWSVYSLRGRHAADPTAVAAQSFLLAAPLAVLLVPFDATATTANGVGVAILSGALTSGLGYVVWYTLLPRVRAATAAVLQLATPPLAALGGTLILAEPVTARLGIASLAILAGIALASLEIRPRRREALGDTGVADRQ